MNPLDTPLNLRLTAKLAKKLEKAGISTVGDLLLEAPRRYYHWGALTPMHILRSGEDVTILAEVVNTRLIPNRSRAGVRLEVLLTDGTSSAFMNACFNRENTFFSPGRSDHIAGICSWCIPSLKESKMIKMIVPFARDPIARSPFIPLKVASPRG